MQATPRFQRRDADGPIFFLLFTIIVRGLGPGRD